MKNSKLMLILGIVGAAGAVFYFWNQSKTKPGTAAVAVAAKPSAPVAQDHTQKYLDLASQILANF